jgi:hypothetical protein
MDPKEQFEPAIFKKVKLDPCDVWTFGQEVLLAVPLDLAKIFLKIIKDSSTKL